MRSYKDLEIYQLSYELAVKVPKFTLRLPKYEQYEEGSQIRKSSKGITSCIVEGYGRKKYKADFIKFLIYSHASCDETIVHLNFIQDILPAEFCMVELRIYIMMIKNIFNPKHFKAKSYQKDIIRRIASLN